MESNIEKMYCNLNDLLQDICKFLTSDKLGNLSSKDKKLVESLIHRSKRQLQEISKIQASPNNDEYVDMDKNKDDTNANVETTFIEEEPAYPFRELPAKDASLEVKYGFMSMKRRFLLGFEKMKRVYGSIHNEWLLVYWNDKELKPICMFDLKKFEAKGADSDKIANFELISTTGNTKVYYFLAQTHKDKLQWVSAINKSHDNTVFRSKGVDLAVGNDIDTINEDDGSDENYHFIKPNNKINKDFENHDDEDIYHEIEMVHKHINKNHVADTATIRPSLPPGRPIGRGLPTPVPPPIIRPLPKSPHISEESIESFEPIGEDDNKTSSDVQSKSFDDEFSEDDDGDSTYETFLNVRETTEKLRNQRQPEDAIRIMTISEREGDPGVPKKVPPLPSDDMSISENIPPMSRPFPPLSEKSSPLSENFPFSEKLSPLRRERSPIPEKFPPLPELLPPLPLKPQLRERPVVPRKPSTSSLSNT